MIRHARIIDLESIMSIIQETQLVFKNERLDQWQNGYPNSKSIEQDINSNKGFVMEEDNKVVAYFYFSIEGDIYYDAIYDGKWLNENEYGVIHRMVVSLHQQRKGYALSCLEFTYKLLIEQSCYDLRIDTHPNNIRMNEFLKKNEFELCGKVNVSDGMRLAYQKNFKKGECIYEDNDC